MRQCHQRAIIQWKGVSRKPIKHHRRAHGSLGTIDDSPLGWEESEATGLPRPWPQVITTSTKLVAGFKETVFLLCTSGSQENVPRPYPQALTPGPGPRLSLALLNMVLDLQRSCAPSLYIRASG